MEDRGFSVARHLGGESEPHSRAMERQHDRARNGIRRVANPGDPPRDDRSRQPVRSTGLSLAACEIAPGGGIRSVRGSSLSRKTNHAWIKIIHFFSSLNDLTSI